jgi:hypothetical protein
MVSAWATHQRLVLGQQAVAEKSNEITAIPLLLQRLQLAGALVTIDAMGTQTEIAQTIIDRDGDYLLSLTANRPATYAEVAEFFARPPQELRCSAARQSTANMIGSRPASTRFATTLIGCSPTAAIRMNRSSLASP